MMKRFFSSENEPPQKRPDLNIDITSLMWLGDRPEPLPEKSERWQQDLGLSELALAMSYDRRYKNFVQQTLVALVSDPAVIRWRQAVLQDFLDHPKLVRAVEELLPSLASLSQNSALLGKRERSPLAQTSERLAELEIYIDAIEAIHKALTTTAVQSTALQTLAANMRTLLDDEDFDALKRQLPAMRRPLERVTSLTVGINLDTQLRPVSAVLMAVNDYQLGGTTSFIDRVIGPAHDGVGERGVAPLNYLPKDPELRPYEPFFQDLEKLMMHVAKPVAQELARYTRISSHPLVNLEFELGFYLSAVKLMNKLQEQGITTCRPDVVPEARVTQIDQLVNVSLALNEKTTVPSDAAFNHEGRIAILTGPNSGGKTTYLQAVGLAQVLFQAGIFIPAVAAQISPVGSLLTHFPRLETRQQGRLAEEAERLRMLFQRVKPHSLVLLNETFSSTSSSEANYLAQDMLCGLRVIGCRAIFATHLSELVDDIPTMHETVEGESEIFSLVAGVKLSESGEAIRTFEITRGEPLGRSYAREIAEKHGISLAQILAAQEE
jgi:DNA mismatch repair protein MutS